MTHTVDDLLDLVGAPPISRNPDFMRLARLTALRRGADGSYYASNTRRGELLYALITHLRPRVVLEIGTGRGYGALCMAMAAVDASIDTRIVTIDQVPRGVQQEWAIDQGDGPTTIGASVNDVWSQLPAEWTARIQVLTGSSTDVMRNWLADEASPAIAFAFIDGGHDIWTVRHDVMAAVLAGKGASVSLLLDDYGGVQGEAVRRFVDDKLLPRVPGAAVHRIAMPQSPAERADNGEHGMVFVDGQSAQVSAEALGWRAPAMAASVARVAASVEAVVWRARSATVRRLRQMGVRG